ncbi:MAG: glutamate--tRNA ligase [Thermoleophilia bacterium]|nr:glutamate--tRNA ligase [Thermoleophilia bacterium]
MTPGNHVPGPARVRFAPSPTGALHVGSARTALYNYLFARHTGGVFILRVEDTDVARSSREFEQSIMDDLLWLGLGWDEGPERGGGAGPYRQSERSAAGVYRDAAKRLLQENKAYHCFCPQERLEELKQDCLDRGEMPRYDRRCALLSEDEIGSRMAAGEPAAIRFKVPAGRKITVADIIHGPTGFESDMLGDFIILRSGGGASYNFAVVVDDIGMEITHVIRGEDHLTNTARQILVFEALGNEPPAFAHHSLIMGPDGGKLSKRHGATSVGEFRSMGYLPGAIVNYLALLSWSPEGGEEKLPLEEMERQFELMRVARSPAIFDIAKLNWLNGLHIRDMSRKDFHEAIQSFLGDAAARKSAGQLAVAEAAIQTALVTLEDAGSLVESFFHAEPLDPAGEAAEIRNSEAGRVLELALEQIDAIKPAAGLDPAAVDRELDEAKNLLGALKSACREENIPPKRLFRTLRIALTGKTSGPELVYLLPGLGRETVRERLEAARRFAAA